MSDVRAGAGLALSCDARGGDPQRLIIPLVRIGRADRGGDQSAGPRPPETAQSREPADPAPAAGTRPSEVAMAWARLTAGSADLVVALDGNGRVLAMSPSAAQLIIGPSAERVTGRHLLDVLDLVDFNPTPGDASMYADRIPPLLAIASNGLSRGLLRVRTSGRTVTLDAIAAPLHDASGALVGTICFLASLGS